MGICVILSEAKNPIQLKRVKTMKKEPTYQDAKKRCRLTDEEMEMARRLGIKPRTLIHNIPAVSGKKEPWKDRPGEWIRKLYRRKYED